jgi:hypothetical protein
MILSETSSASFTPCPAGTYPARLVRIVDLGTQTTEYQGEAKHARKVLLTWEIVDPDTRTDDDRPYLISKRYTASLHEKAGLRRDLAAWRGQDFTPAELARFDLATLLGKPVLIGIVHSTKGERTFANVASLSRMPKGMQAGEPTEPPLHFDLTAPDWGVFDLLGDRLKTQIAASPEYAAAYEKASKTQPAPALADMDDDIPF